MRHLVPLCTLIVLAAGAGMAARAQPILNNPYGVHLTVGRLSEDAEQQLLWAQQLVGPRGYVKVFFQGIDAQTRGATQGQRDLIQRIYDLDLIPVVRLAGHYDAELGYWHKPVADANGRYMSYARAAQSLVAGLPRKDGTPLYIEVWNEPNLDLEWSGKANLAEYGRFLVEVATTLRTLGDERIKVLNGAFGLSAESAREMFKAVPESAHAFDIWASHPYPHNHPPEYNHHDGTAVAGDVHTIDSYLLELAVVKQYRGETVPVMITETGHDLGNSTFVDDGYPLIDDTLRADYTARAFRDYWTQWPEVVAVLPFLFCDAGWERFNWVEPGSETDGRGLPKRRYRQYDAVRALAKPSMPTGGISGRVTETRSGLPIAGVQVQGGGSVVESGERGLYFLPEVPPGEHKLYVSAQGFERKTVSSPPVRAGANVVQDIELVATGKGAITGTVLNGMTGQPIVGARVECTPPAMVEITDALGRFTFTDQPPVGKTLLAAYAGFTAHRLEGVIAQPAPGTTVTLRISPEAEPEQPNLLRNATFDENLGGTVSGGAALAWEPLGKPGRFDVATERARTGLAAQRIRATGTSTVRQITHYNTAKPGNHYNAQVWASAEGLDGRAFLRLCATDNSGAALGCADSAGQVSGTAGWTLLTVSSECPAGAQRISVELHVESNAGAVYWDDAYLGTVAPVKRGVTVPSRP